MRFSLYEVESSQEKIFSQRIKATDKSPNSKQLAAFIRWGCQGEQLVVIEILDIKEVLGKGQLPSVKLENLALAGAV